VVVGGGEDKMKLHTASEVVSFARELENESATFYQNLSRQYAKEEDVFLSFAKDNGKNIVQIERAYYGVISDAIEGAFAFDIETDEYKFETTLAEKASYSDAVDKAIKVEETIVKFYSDAADQSKSLMADIPRTFATIARKGNDRITKLKSLVGGD
jgi:rubrerythrin